MRLSVMANITKRLNKDGSFSFRFRAYAGKINGKEIYKSMTWNAPLTMKDATAEKEAYKQAILFEEKLQKGVTLFEGKTRFAEYATAWVANEPLAYTTRKRYEDLLKRIIPAIGHIKLEELQAHHLDALYSNLAEPGVKNKGRYAESNKLDKILKQRKLSRLAVADMAGVATTTVSVAAQGKRISTTKAEAISKALDIDGRVDKVGQKAIKIFPYMV